MLRNTPPKYKIRRYRIGRGLRTTGVYEPDTKSTIIITLFCESYKHN